MDKADVLAFKMRACQIVRERLQDKDIVVHEGVLSTGFSVSSFTTPRYGKRLIEITSPEELELTVVDNLVPDLVAYCHSDDVEVVSLLTALSVELDITMSYTGEQFVEFQAQAQHHQSPTQRQRVIARVIAEKDELDGRVERLYTFLLSDTCGELPEAEQDRLSRQYDAMIAYLGVLEERIEAFDS